MFCVNCGKQIETDFIFCPYCGVNIKSGANAKDNKADFEIVAGVLKAYKGSDLDVVIPEGVIEISRKAFEAMKHLRSITMPNTVEKIDFGAFSECESLTKVVLSESLREIPDSAFARCKNLSEIILPQGITEIGSGAFCDTNLKSIVIPGNVHMIKRYTFARCAALEHVVIPEGVQFIGHYAFEKCTALTNIAIPDSLSKIEDEVFNGCTNLTNIMISREQRIKFWRNLKTTPWWSNWYQEQKSEGRCPSCGEKLSVFKKCKSCGIGM